MEEKEINGGTIKDEKFNKDKFNHIVTEILQERIKQEAKWGQQNYPILDQLLINRTPKRMCDEYEIPSEDRARQLLNINEKRGSLTYMHILIEEISEVASCGRNMGNIREELIQSAAVLVAMIESLDRNGF